MDTIAKLSTIESLDELNETQKRAIARHLKTRISEFNEQNETDTFVFEDIQIWLAEIYPKLHVSKLKQIISLLRLVYQDTTIQNLLKNYARPILLDTSVCGISQDELQQLIFSKRQTFITSTTFTEIQNLAQKKPESDEATTPIQNARWLFNLIMSDTKSEICQSIMLDKTGYVDDLLIQFCSNLEYELHTSDVKLYLRCLARGIPATLYCYDYSTFGYTVNPKAPSILLHSSIIQQHTPFEQIIKAINLINGKFIITQTLSDIIEKTSDFTSSQIAHFLVAIHKKENAVKFTCDDNYPDYYTADIAKKYGATIISSDPEFCFYCKSIGQPYVYVNAPANNIPTVPIIPDIISEGRCFDKAFDTPIGEESIPHFTRNYHILFNNLNSSFERMWVFDQAGNEQRDLVRNKVQITEGFIILYAKRTNDLYQFTEYIVTCRPPVGKVFGRWTFRSGQSSASVLPAKYKTYGEKFSLLT